MAAIATMPRLTSLDLVNDAISQDGSCILLEVWSRAADASQFRWLFLDKSNVRGLNLPPDAVNRTDAQAILAAYREGRDAGRQV